jgi:hypothetical protein
MLAAMPVRPSFSDALTRALAAPPPAWDRVLGLAYGGVTHGFSLTVQVKPGFDLPTLEQVVAGRWPREHGVYARGGRTIRFSARHLVLAAVGTAQAPPHDDGLQSALLLALVDAARGAIVAVTTDRWTDSPFEEPPARRRTAASARDFVEGLVRCTFGLCIEHFGFFTTSTNPEVGVTLAGAQEAEFGVRARWLPVWRWLPPGTYTLTARACPFAFPDYHPDLQGVAREALWVSAPLQILGAPGEIRRLRLEAVDLALTPAERAFLAQRGADTAPPPTPREHLRWG